MRSRTPLASRPSLKRQKFHQRLVFTRTADQPSFALEIFAATARLTACLRSLGLVDSVGIDCTMPTRSIIKLDLLQPSHLQLVQDLITNRACVYVHFAPPCGTASRVRLIQYSDGSMPPPLRNDDYPNGLPWLTEDQQERVNKANQLHHITCEHIVLCQENSILWSCENPGRSFMWQTTSFQHLFSTIECISTEMHHCMFGSSRRKLTRSVYNIQSFHQLHQMRDNQHEHEPWYVIFPASLNTNAHFKPCVLPPIFSHAETCHHWCHNLNKSSTKIPKPLCHLMLVFSAFPKGVCRECQREQRQPGHGGRSAVLT